MARKRVRIQYNCLGLGLAAFMTDKGPMLIAGAKLVPVFPRAIRGRNAAVIIFDAALHFCKNVRLKRGCFLHHRLGIGVLRFQNVANVRIEFGRVLHDLAPVFIF